MLEEMIVLSNDQQESFGKGTIPHGIMICDHISYISRGVTAKRLYKVKSRGGVVGKRHNDRSSLGE